MWVALCSERDMTAPDGRLRHSWRAGRAAHPATLDDHANLSRAALLLYEATGKPDYLAHARAWVELVERYTRRQGLWFDPAAEPGRFRHGHGVPLGEVFGEVGLVAGCRCADGTPLAIPFGIMLAPRGSKGALA